MIEDHQCIPPFRAASGYAFWGGGGGEPEVAPSSVLVAVASEVLLYRSPLQEWKGFKRERKGSATKFLTVAFQHCADNFGCTPSREALKQVSQEQNLQHRCLHEQQHCASTSPTRGRSIPERHYCCKFQREKNVPPAKILLQSFVVTKHGSRSCERAADKSGLYMLVYASVVTFYSSGVQGFGVFFLLSLLA